MKKGKKSGKGGPPKAIAQAARLAREQAEQEEQKRLEEEQAEQVRFEQAEAARIQREKLRQEEEERIKQERKVKKEEEKRLGLYRTKAQLKAEQKNQVKLDQLASSGAIKSHNEAKPMGLISGKKKKRAVEAAEETKEEVPEAPATEEERKEQIIENWESLIEDDSTEQLTLETTEITNEGPQNEPGHRLKSPILCILGHVDTGKTKLLDKIRNTNVQLGEAGGITQQIGATFFPGETIQLLTSKLPNFTEEIQVPGVLIIDTPGHESFSNLRSRGSSLCNLGILVVDIMHGLENQTKESLGLLLSKNIPFIVALNKIDQLNLWNATMDEGFLVTFAKQVEHTVNAFNKRVSEICVQFAEQGLNAALYYEEGKEDYIKLVPTSAITGEGIPDLLSVIIITAQKSLVDSLIFVGTLEATVMEVKIIDGLGVTIDVMLANGRLREGDTIVLSGRNGPIITNIRALLTPQPLKEMRVKGEYINHKVIEGSMGVKISAPDLEKAIPGSPLYVANSEEEIESFTKEVDKDFSEILKLINKKGVGVYVQASTIGSLEALLEFLKQNQIPVSGLNIGTVHKKDVLKAQVQLEKNAKKEYASILAFDVKISHEAQELANSSGVKIFMAGIIYHLTDQYTAYIKEIKEENKRAQGLGKTAVFPCILKIISVFRMNNPVVLGVSVAGGLLQVGTPLCVPERGNLIIGKVETIELNHKTLQSASLGQEVGIKIQPMNSDQHHISAGKSFEENNQIASWLTRESIDALKEYFRDEMTMDWWKIVKLLKTQYGII